MIVDTETDILQRVLEADPGHELTPEASRYLLTLGFSPNDHRRIDELAEKSNEGTLTVEERAELERYNRVRLLLVRLKSRARHVLANIEDAEPQT
jgi:uncharacterized protein YnzC (UPF0291/DUF896 family)